MAKKHFNWIPLIVLLFCLGVLCVTGFALRKWQRNRTAYNALSQGLKAYNNCIWEQAVINLQRYLAVNRTDVQTLLKYAEAQLNIRPLKPGNVRQAAATYRNILRLDKNNKQAAEKLISLYLQMNIPAEAQLIAERYLQQNENPNIETMLAIAFIKQRKFTEASAALQALIEQYPQHIAACEILAQLSENYPEYFPDTPEYWFRQAIHNNPSSADAFVARAAFYLRTKQIDKARADLEKAEQLELSDVRVRLRLATQFTNIRMCEKARAHLEAAHAVDPKNLTLWQTWADLALTDASKEEMLKVARTGLKQLEHAAWDFMPAAAELFIKSGRFGSARNCLDKLKQKDIEPATTLFLEGLLARAQNEYHKAISFWRQTQHLPDKSQQSRLALAKAYCRVGDSQSALLQLRTLLSEQPSLLQARLELATLLSQSENWPEAAEQARLAVQAAPDNLDAVLLHIWTQMQLIRTDYTNENETICNKLEKQLTELENITAGALRVKLLQFQLAVQREKLADAEQILINLKSNENGCIELGIAEADLLVVRNKQEQAIAHLHSLIEQFPENVLPVKYIAALLADRDDTTGCEKVLEDALRRIENPLAKRDLTILLADYCRQFGDYTKALRLLTQLAEQLHDDIPVKRQILHDPHVKKDIKHAMLIVNDIKALEGEDGWQWRYEHANILFNQQNFESRYPQIIALLKENLLNNPADQTSRLLLAATYEKAGQLQLAVATYRDALGRSPHDLRIIVPAVAAFYKAKEYETAERILNSAAEKNLFHPQISKLRMQSYLRQGKLSSAESILEDLAAQNPQNSDILISLALLKMRQNKYDQARQLLEKLKPAQLHSVPLAAALVELNVRQDKTQEALSLCDEIVKQLGSASAHILRAKTFLVLGKNDQAGKDFKHAIDIEPNNIRTWMAKTDFHRSIGETELAVQNIQKAMMLAPDNIQIQKHAVTLLLSSAQPQNINKGRQLLEKALSSQPHDIELRLLETRCLMNEKTAPAIEQAENILQTITEEQPKTTEAWALWAQIYLEQTQIGKAMDIILNGLTYSPDDKNLLLLKARTEAARAPALAIPTLKLLTDREQDDTQTTLELAGMYTAAGQCDKSIALLQKLLLHCRQTHRRTINTALAVAFYKNGNKKQATQLFHKLYESEPDDSEPFLTEINLLAEEQSWDIISEKVNDWAQRNPDNLDTPVNIAKNLAATKNHHALTIAENILRRVLNTSPRYLEAMNLLAMILQMTDQYSESEALYRQILELDPDALIAANNLAWILCEQKKQYPQALELAQSHLRKAPQYVDLIDTRGVIHYRMGQHEKAVQDFTGALNFYLKNSPAAAACRFHLARALAASGHTRTAAENLRQALNLTTKVGGLSENQIAQARHLLDKLSQEKNNELLAR